MKNLKILLVFAAFCLISTVSFAQVETIEEVETEVQDKTEVALADLPEAVTNTLKGTYADYVAEKAYKSLQDGKETYSIFLVKEEEFITVAIDAEGNVIVKDIPEEEEDKEEEKL